MFTGEFSLWLSGLRTQHGIPEDAGSTPSLAQWFKDLALPQALVQVTDATRIWHLASLCLWHRLAAAALIQPLAWELLNAMCAAIKKEGKKKKKKNVQRKENKSVSSGIHGEEPIPILYLEFFAYMHASIFLKTFTYY